MSGVWNREVENMLPPSVLDIIRNMRDSSKDRNYRENLATRLEIIAQTCQDEVKRYRTNKKFNSRKRA